MKQTILNAKLVGFINSKVVFMNAEVAAEISVDLDVANSYWLSLGPDSGQYSSALRREIQSV